MSKSVLIVPGTGKQGQAAARVFLQRGYSVHSLVRNAASETSDKLKAIGVTLHVGDLSSLTSIQDAFEDIDCVFFAIPAHPVNEVTYAKNIIEAAKSKGVQTVTYTSVARTGEHENFPGWSDKYPLAWYWKNKHIIENLVRTAAFEHWTILRPAFFTQNFYHPEVQQLFPGLAESGRLRVAYKPDTRLDVIDTESIALFAAAAIDSPILFSGKEIALAAESLTAREIAERLGRVSNQDIVVEFIDDAEADRLVEQGHLAVAAQQWQRDVGYNVDVEALKAYDVPLTGFSEALARDGLRW